MVSVSGSGTVTQTKRMEEDKVLMWKALAYHIDQLGQGLEPSED